MSGKIGERHASACRYKYDVPEGSRRSARRIHFWPCEVYNRRFTVRYHVSRPFCTEIERGSCHRPDEGAEPKWLFVPE